jgi:hypothetical protein
LNQAKEQDREDQRLAEHDPRQRAPLQALSDLERLADQNDLAENQSVHDGEALQPDADPMPLDHLLVQVEQREQEPEIDGDDRVFSSSPSARSFTLFLLPASTVGGATFCISASKRLRQLGRWQSQHQMRAVPTHCALCRATFLLISYPETATSGPARRGCPPG